MSLTLHFHPLASYCHKALIALYESGTPFETEMVNLGDPDGVAAFRKISPMGKMPALVDAVRAQNVWEATIVIEYLDAFHPGTTRMIPADPDGSWHARLWDRFYDNYVHDPMQRIVADRLKPEAKRAAEAVRQFKAQLEQAYDVIEAEMAARRWAAGNAFTLADCAAAPALFYADIVAPIGPARVRVQAYLERLMARPSYARVLQEAKPYFQYYPFVDLLKLRHPGLAG